MVPRARNIVSAALAFPVCAALGTGPAMAAGGTPDSSARQGATANADYRKAETLIEAGKFAEAIPLLRRAGAKLPDDADVHNYLGYALRKLQRYDAALKHYRIALRIAPRHRGANEYLGELYLALGQLAKAEDRLAALDRACPFGCEEYTELREAIEAYRARRDKGE